MSPTPTPTLTPAGSPSPAPLVAAVADSTPWITPSIVISLLALSFTILSFWWIQVRRGKLSAYTHLSYAGAFSGTKVHMSIPLVFHNSGPAPIVVLNLRLRVDSTSEENVSAETFPWYLSWAAIQPKLAPASTDGSRLMPAPFPVEGRRAELRFIEFVRSTPPANLAAGPIDVAIEVMTAHRPQWTQILAWSMHTEVGQGGQAGGAFLVRTSDPDWTG